MLILSRRAEQQVMFPHLGICINVLQVKGKVVKLGVEAPKSVRVLRNELAEFDEPESPLAAPLDHQQRNALNLLNLRIQLIQSRLNRGEPINAQEVLDSLLERFSAIDHSLCTSDVTTPLCRNARPVRLLVVEDSENERNLMAYLLASHGFDVEVASDGRVAIDQLTSGGSLPDFVLMDMQMPHADGLETLLEIRSSETLRHLKVFAVTGTKRDPRNEPVDRGWDGWFCKPLNVPKLVDHLYANLEPAEPPLAV